MFRKFTTTGIGSLPHNDPERACSIVLDTVDIPFWPQLPRISFRELMIPQYSEGMPLIRINEEEQKIWVAGNGSEEINTFYETYDEEAEFSISEDFSKGFYQFIGSVKGGGFEVLKGHVTGPLTFSLGLKDENGVPVYFNEELREIALMLLKGKIRWQINRLGEFCDRVMLFVDEPILSAIGTSSYMGVSESEVKRLLKEIVSSIKTLNGIPAIHCCGKADWKMVMETGIDVVNFDAFDYFENFQIYVDALKDFLNRGGYIAWGIVPTGEAIHDITLKSLKDGLVGRIDELSRKIGMKELDERILLTPSCGAGSLREDEAERVFTLLHELKQDLSV